MDLVPLQHRVDAFQRSHRPAAFIVGVVRHTSGDRGSQLAALLAYYGFLSLFPLLLVLVTVLRVVLADDPELQERVLGTALAQVPVVGDDLAQVGPASGHGWILVLGTLVALWAGLGILDTLQDVLLRVWEIPAADHTGFVSRKVRSLALVVVFGVALAVLIGVGTVGAVVDLPLVSRLVTLVLSAGVATAVALTALVVLGGGGPPWRDHAPGAVVIGVGWVVLQVCGTWLIATRIREASATYGTFAIVIGLMAWLTILGWLVVLASEINVVRSKHLWPVDLFPAEPTA